MTPLTIDQPWEVATVTQVPYDLAVDDERTDIFLQWKGTDVCFTLNCECGESSHFDGFFANAVECPGCHAVYLLPSTVYPLNRAKASPGTFEHRAVVPDLDDDDD